MTVRKAVFPVAGLGTRFLPATKAVPKELLPVVDRPLVQYAVDEALEAGIETMIFVTGRNKGAIEDHFDVAYELERIQADRGKPLDALEGTRLTFTPDPFDGQVVPLEVPYRELPGRVFASADEARRAWESAEVRMLSGVAAGGTA